MTSLTPSEVRSFIIALFIFAISATAVVSIEIEHYTLRIEDQDRRISDLANAVGGTTALLQDLDACQQDTKSFMTKGKGN